MYGEPGGLQGETTIAQLLSNAGYITQAVGKWHVGENSASQAQNVGFDDFYGFLSVSDMYSEWRDPHFFPEMVYSEARTEATLESMSSCHMPRRAKMCPGMCRAWAEAGAIAAYFSAAGSPSRASCGLSQV